MPKKLTELEKKIRELKGKCKKFWEAPLKANLSDVWDTERQIKNLVLLNKVVWADFELDKDDLYLLAEMLCEQKYPEIIFKYSEDLKIYTTKELDEKAIFLIRALSDEFFSINNINKDLFFPEMSSFLTTKKELASLNEKLKNQVMAKKQILSKQSFVVSGKDPRINYY
jgi:hypothetical protein